jgi:hypothetical protein
MYLITDGEDSLLQRYLHCCVCYHVYTFDKPLLRRMWWLTSNSQQCQIWCFHGGNVKSSNLDYGGDWWVMCNINKGRDLWVFERDTAELPKRGKTNTIKFTSVIRWLLEIF